MAACIICETPMDELSPSCCSDACRAQADVELSRLGGDRRELAARVMAGTRSGWRRWLPAERTRQDEVLGELREVEAKMRDLLAAKLSTAGVESGTVRDLEDQGSSASKRA